MTAQYILNELPAYDQNLDPRDAETLSIAGCNRILEVLSLRQAAVPTSAALTSRARPRMRDRISAREGRRLSPRAWQFKALGGAYALMILVQEEASRRLGRGVEGNELTSDAVRAIAATMTFACATDGNHGRSVAQGAQLMGSRAVIFVHDGVSQARTDAIARFGAEIVRVDGNYDSSVQKAARVSNEEGWTVLSDTSWPGYEYIPGLVAQGYTAMIREVPDELSDPPSHVFLQAGVDGFAAAIAGHMTVVLGDARPH